ncbi:MAG: LacI family DNA-binding transcriptional regulator [Planctomycetes bacterium]|nr:LacI family DNA-binding transcriptional regulator [Planctomycetota bacterium]
MARPEVVGRILECLLRELATGHWPEGRPVAPMRALAKQWGVSQETAMAALRRAGGLGLLNVQPRHRTVVEPGAAARALEVLHETQRKAEVSRVALLVGSPLSVLEYHPFFATFRRLACERGLARRIQIEVVQWPLREQVEFARSLPARGYRAALSLGLKPVHWVGVTWMHDHGYPVVVVNRDLPGMGVSTVRGDGFAAMQQLARHLIDLGHRNLCLITHFMPGASGAGLDEAEGWMQVLEETGLGRECTMPVCVLPWEPFMRENSHPFDNIFGRRDHPTAVVFVSPMWAKQMLSDARFRRFRVPEDVSVAVLHVNDPPLTISGLPPLTHIGLNHRRLVDCVIEVLSEMLAGDLTPRRLLLPLDVTLTESIGPPTHGSPVAKGPGPCAP